jgi:hypothetical protein
LFRPRATLAALAAEEGRHDEWVLIGAFIAGSQVDRLAEGVASVLAVGLGDGVLVLASVAARAVLPPILVSFLIETVLGRARGHRRALFLVPLVVVATLGRVAGQEGIAWPGPGFLPELVGAALSLLLAAAARSAVPGVQEGRT